MTNADADLPRVLRTLWGRGPRGRGAAGLNRDRIVSAAIELADGEGLAALSMARLAERLGCGTMSLYRHIAGKDELILFMLAAAPGPPPAAGRRRWRAALTLWAEELWAVYHRHPWILHAGSAGPPADPGQLAWLDSALAALADTRLSERDKVSAVTSMLHYVRGAAALAIDSRYADADWPHYADLLRTVVDVERFPALGAAMSAGVFDADAVDSPRRDFDNGLRWVLDGIEVVANRPQRR